MPVYSVHSNQLDNATATCQVPILPLHSLHIDNEACRWGLSRLRDPTRFKADGDPPRPIPLKPVEGASSTIPRCDYTHLDPRNVAADHLDRTDLNDQSASFVDQEVVREELVALLDGHKLDTTKSSKGVDRFGRQVPGKPRIGSSHHDDYIDVERMAHTFAGGHNRLSMETPDDLVARSRDRCTPKRHDQQ